MSAGLLAIGPYVLHRRIARGGMAEVYLASDSREGAADELVAVKRIRPEYSDDPSFVRMFLDEARITRLLNHPNIARLTDFGEADGSPYLVMEFVEGASLRQLLRHGPIPGELTVEVGAAAARALHAAHEQRDENGKNLGVVHRDVTPQNVMVTFQGQIKLLDFGIALARVRAERTRTGVLKGKWAYMSPEQVQGRRLDRRSDVFSLGALLYEAATGKRAFDGDSPSEVLNAVLLRIPPGLSLANGGLPQGLADVVKVCLAKDPEDRYPSAEAAAEALEKLIAARGTAQPPDLGAYVHACLPELQEQVTQTQQEIETQTATASPAEDDEPTLVEPAPFEELADDLLEPTPQSSDDHSSAPWPTAGTGSGRTPTHPTRREETDGRTQAIGVSPSLVVGAVLILGATLGLTAAYLVWLLALAP